MSLFCLLFLAWVLLRITAIFIVIASPTLYICTCSYASILIVLARKLPHTFPFSVRGHFKDRQASLFCASFFFRFCPFNVMIGGGYIRGWWALFRYKVISFWKSSLISQYSAHFKGFRSQCFNLFPLAWIKNSSVSHGLPSCPRSRQKRSPRRSGNHMSSWVTIVCCYMYLFIPVLECARGVWGRGCNCLTADFLLRTTCSFLRGLSLFHTLNG